MSDDSEWGAEAILEYNPNFLDSYSYNADSGIAVEENASQISGDSGTEGSVAGSEVEEMPDYTKWKVKDLKVSQAWCGPDVWLIFRRP